MVVKVVLRSFEYERGYGKHGQPINLFREYLRTAVNKYDTALDYCIEDLICTRADLTKYIVPIDGHWTTKQVEDLCVYVFSYSYYENMNNFTKEIFREASFFSWLKKNDSILQYNAEDLYVTIGRARYYRCGSDDEIERLIHVIECWMSW